MAISVFLVDKSLIVRQSLQALLEQVEGLDVVGDAGDAGRSAVARGWRVEVIFQASSAERRPRCGT